MSCIAAYCEDTMGLAAALYADMRLEQNDGRQFVGVYEDGKRLFAVPLAQRYLSVDDAINSGEFTSAFGRAAENYKESMELV